MISPSGIFSINLANTASLISPDGPVGISLIVPKIIWSIVCPLLNTLLASYVVPGVPNIAGSLPLPDLYSTFNSAAIFSKGLTVK